MKKAIAIIAVLAASFCISIIVGNAAGASGPNPCTMSKQEYQAIKIGETQMNANYIVQCTGVVIMNQDTPGHTQRLVRWNGGEKHSIALIVFRNYRVLRKVYSDPGSESTLIPPAAIVQ